MRFKVTSKIDISTLASLLADDVLIEENKFLFPTLFTAVEAAKSELTPHQLQTLVNEIIKFTLQHVSGEE